MIIEPNSEVIQFEYRFVNTPFYVIILQNNYIG